MKKITLISAAFMVSFLCAAISPTSFTFQFYDASGQPDTNYTTMQANSITLTKGTTECVNDSLWILPRHDGIGIKGEEEGERIIESNVVSINASRNNRCWHFQHDVLNRDR